MHMLTGWLSEIPVNCPSQPLGRLTACCEVTQKLIPGTHCKKWCPFHWARWRWIFSSCRLPFISSCFLAELVRCVGCGTRSQSLLAERKRKCSQDESGHETRSRPLEAKATSSVFWPTRIRHRTKKLGNPHQDDVGSTPCYVTETFWRPPNVGSRSPPQGVSWKFWWNAGMF